MYEYMHMGSDDNIRRFSVGQGTHGVMIRREIPRIKCLSSAEQFQTVEIVRMQTVNQGDSLKCSKIPQLKRGYVLLRNFFNKGDVGYQSFYLKEQSLVVSSLTRITTEVCTLAELIFESIKSALFLIANQQLRKNALA